MEKIESRLSKVSITNNDVQSIEIKWGWSLKDLYRNALNFYKGKFECFLINIYKSTFCLPLNNDTMLLRVNIITRNQNITFFFFFLLQKNQEKLYNLHMKII